MKQMKNRTVGLVIGLMLAMLVGVVTAQKPETAPAMMEAAKQKAIVEGDLAGATKLYQAIVDRFAKTDRAAAAAALLEIAAIHQQTGNDSQSKLTLTQIVGQYADQRDVASVAQARLAQLKNVNASESSVRQTRTLVWSDTSVKRHLSAVVSPNGRFVGYSDQWAVYIDDLSSGATRRLVIPGTERAYAKQLAFANDAKSLFYTWRDSAARHDDVRVVQLSGTAVPEPQILFRNEDIPVVMHPAVSPDGRWIAANIVHRDRSVQIALSTVADGSLRVLKSIDWQGTGRLEFSPDGRYIGYDAALGNKDRQRDLFILAVDGSSEHAVAPSPFNDEMVDWTPDGQRVLFMSSRLGSPRLWSAAVVNGRPTGVPEAVQVSVGGAARISVSGDGALFYGTVDDAPRMQVASFDFESGRFISEPEDVAVGAHPPVWSPDGKALALVASGITIRSLDSDRVETLTLALTYFSNLKWSPDGRSVAVNGSDRNGRRGIYLVDRATSDVRSLVSAVESGAEPELLNWSPDGRSIYYVRSSAVGMPRSFTVLERDASSGTEREVLRHSGDLHSASLSPDRQNIAATFTNPVNRAHQLLIAPTRGGESRVLMDAGSSELHLAMWSPDARAVFVSRRDAAGAGVLWRVPIDGSQPRETVWRVKNVGPVSVHRDGRRIAFVAGTTKALNIWKVSDAFRPALKHP
jgi:Tol biopolymer transport system component